ncbi:hypothetical protein [Photorhabdus aegyptia]|uniref:hypothetical protein n=1 Tax=Photorhabdus aegyptia TaxID=2805098 RepID=UPI001E2C47C2|nr:hypothetical protein [Photorhabdus aegyptia]MCC8460157.1 hypothetical protein [Photorhabdus aegyptia]
MQFHRQFSDLPVSSNNNLRFILLSTLAWVVSFSSPDDCCQIRQVIGYFADSALGPEEMGGVTCWRDNENQVTLPAYNLPSHVIQAFPTSSTV